MTRGPCPPAQVRPGQVAAVYCATMTRYAAGLFALAALVAAGGAASLIAVDAQTAQPGPSAPHPPRCAAARWGVRRRAHAARLGRGRARRTYCRRRARRVRHQRPPERARSRLAGLTLMPGHDRGALAPAAPSLQRDDVERPGADASRWPIAWRAPSITRERTLMAGFTTVRDLGTEGAGLRRRGTEARRSTRASIPGPRMLVAGPAMVATGSYGPKGFALGVHACRRAPRKPTGSKASRAWRAIRSATAWTSIKIYADYRWGPNGETRPTFTLSEITAHRRGGEEQRAAGGGTCLHARGHAPRDRRRRGDDRARRRGHARDLETDGREGRGLLPDDRRPRCDRPVRRLEEGRAARAGTPGQRSATPSRPRSPRA